MTIVTADKAATYNYIANTTDAEYKLIPQVFVDQAELGFLKFQVDKALLEAGQIRIEITDPVAHELGVDVKIRLTGIMNYTTGELVVMEKGKQKGKDEDWLRGFRSVPVRLDQDTVNAGYITAAELEAFQKYAELAAELGDDFYAKGANARKRLWLTPTEDNAVFQFNLETRPNPSATTIDFAYVPGLVDIGWRGMSLIGYGINGEAQSIVDIVENQERTEKVNLRRNRVEAPVAPVAETSLKRSRR